MNQKPNWWNIIVGCLMLFPALKFPIDMPNWPLLAVIAVYASRLLVIALAARIIWSGVPNQKAQIR